MSGFDGVERKSRLFFQVLLVLVLSNLLFGTLLVFINSVLNRSPYLINVTDAAFTAYIVHYMCAVDDLATVFFVA